VNCVNWQMVAALVASLSALVAMAAIWFSHRATRFSIGVQTLLQLESRFDSSEMRRSRSALASYALAQPPTGEIPDEAYAVISLFETLGFLLRRKAIDLEMAWNSFDPWVPLYWSALETVSTERRKTVADPTLWQDWQHAAQRITYMQAQRSKATVEYVQTRYDARRIQFLREEANWSAPTSR
jgi:hypothetical protein